MVSRISNNQVETDIILPECLEICWRAFNKLGYQSCVIDTDRSEVQGTKTKSFLTFEHSVITVRVEDNHEHRLVSLSVVVVDSPPGPVNPRFINRLMKVIIEELNVGHMSTFIPVTDKVSPPIPSPHGGMVYQSNVPVYGVVIPVQNKKQKAGSIVFICGLLGLLTLLAHFFAIFAITAVLRGGLEIKDYFDDSSQEKSMSFDIILTALGFLFGAAGILISLLHM